MVETAQHQMSARRLQALDRIDQMPGDLRAVAHEFGLPIVDACLQVGVREPNHIRQLVYVIWQGARQPAQRTAKRKGMTRVMESLDWLLVQSGAEINAHTLVRVLAQNGMLIVPRDPTNQMVDASLEEVSGYNVRVTKEEKHRRRLRAALKACVDHLWPHLNQS